MASYTENYVRKNSWVKDLLKTYDPEMLADLLEKRIKFPSSTGPFVSVHQKETPLDIINSFIKEGPDDFKGKIEPAVGLLLYKMIHGKMDESNDILKELFLIIRESKLTECNTLIQSWLNHKASFLVSKNVREQEVMRDALMALARIQKKDSVLEHYWFSLWRNGQSCYWTPAFHGLRQQNPKMAAQELQLLIERNISKKLDKAIYLLSGMWNDENSRHQLECTIKKGLNNNFDWAGLALNLLLERLNDTQKSELMTNLK